MHLDPKLKFGFARFEEEKGRAQRAENLDLSAKTARSTCYKPSHPRAVNDKKGVASGHLGWLPRQICSIGDGFHRISQRKSGDALRKESPGLWGSANMCQPVQTKWFEVGQVMSSEPT